MRNKFVSVKAVSALAIGLLVGFVVAAPMTSQAAPEAAVRVVSGKAPACQWAEYMPGVIWMEVDTTSAGFTKAPTYSPSIIGGGNHWPLVGATSVYAPGSGDLRKGFRIYLSSTYSGYPATPANACGSDWRVQWTATE